MEGIAIIVIALIAIAAIILGRKLHIDNQKRLDECNKFITYDQVDEWLIPVIGTYSNANKQYNYVYTDKNMPLGRASAFLNFFGKSIYNEEPYLFLCKRSSKDNEFREYGCMFARTGIYFSDEINVGSKEIASGSKNKYVSFYGLTQAVSFGSLLITINVKPGAFFDKIQIISLSDSQISMKATNIAILENKDKGELFVSMPRYRSNERDESNGVIYKDVCNPITAEFREELYTNILDAYARIREPEKEETQKQEHTKEMPEFSVTVTPYEREGSNIKGLARIYFENSFIVNNINIVQGKEKIFVSMPSYKTKQVDEQGKPIYQDVCYPVTKDFREKLYNEIISEYEKAKDKSNEKARESAEKHHGNPDKEKDKEATPFR